MASFAETLIDCIEAALARGDRRLVALHEPSFGDDDWLLVKDCLDSNWVSTAGPYVSAFEDALKQFTGSPYAVATNSGTAALHLCLHACGCCYGDEILLPSLTFVATANAISYTGATPHFVDIEAVRLGIDPAALRDYLHEIVEWKDGRAHNRSTGRRLKALLPVHAFGFPCCIGELAEVADEFGLSLIEDAAESLGSLDKGCHTGLTGIAAALSFNGNKIITTGGGGAILTRDEALMHRLKHLSSTAKQSHPWRYFHDEVGFNYRLPNLNAALGCAQLRDLPQRIEAKRTLAEAYWTAFSDFAGASVQREATGCRSNYWLVCLVLEAQHRNQLDAVLSEAHRLNLMLRPCWTPLHRLPMYSNCPRSSLHCTEDLVDRLINLPSSPFLAPST